jgi:hypothetical protein
MGEGEELGLEPRDSFEATRARWGWSRGLTRGGGSGRERRPPTGRQPPVASGSGIRSGWGRRGRRARGQRGSDAVAREGWWEPSDAGSDGQGALRSDGMQERGPRPALLARVLAGWK